MDIVYLGILAVWSLATWGLLRLCDRLSGHEEASLPSSRKEEQP